MSNITLLDQSIIGLNSFNPLKRMISESNFHHALLITNRSDDKTIRNFINFIKRKRIDLTINEPFALQTNKNFDVIISIGSEFIHKKAYAYKSNNTKFYAIETIPGRTTAILRDNMPNLIFNSCHQSFVWNDGCVKYYLTNIKKVLTIIIQNNVNPCVQSWGINGVITAIKNLYVVKNIKQIPLSIYTQLTYADLMMRLCLFHHSSIEEQNVLIKKIFNENQATLEKLIVLTNSTYDEIYGLLWRIES